MFLWENIKISCIALCISLNLLGSEKKPELVVDRSSGRPIVYEASKFRSIRYNDPYGYALQQTSREVLAILSMQRIRYELIKS